MIESSRSRALKRFWERNDARGINPNWVRKVSLILDALDRARMATELDIVGLGFHPLTGDLSGRYAVTVTRNWRITFEWSGENAVHVDLEDYHGG